MHNILPYIATPHPSPSGSTTTAEDQYTWWGGRLGVLCHTRRCAKRPPRAGARKVRLVGYEEKMGRWALGRGTQSGQPIAIARPRPPKFELFSVENLKMFTDSSTATYNRYQVRPMRRNWPDYVFWIFQPRSKWAQPRLAPSYLWNNRGSCTRRVARQQCITGLTRGLYG